MRQSNVVRPSVTRALCISWIVSLLCVAGSSAEINQDELGALVEQIEPSVVTIHTWRGWKRWFGSGFLVNQFGDVITASHVVQNASFIKVETRGGSIFPVHRILAENVEEDVALLSSSVPRHIARPLQVDSILPRVGEDVVLVRLNSMEEPEVLTGAVTSVLMIPGVGRFVAVRAPIRGGWSGSAVVNTNGKVIGVVARFIPGEGTLFSVAPAEEISRLLAQKGLDFFDLKEEQIDPSICSAEDLYAGGQMCYRERDYRKASYYFRLAVKKDPDFFDAYVLAAWCHSELEEHQDAAGMLEHALRLRPFNPDVHKRLGRAYENMGLAEEALTCYEQVVQLKPDDWMTRFTLGLTYQQRKEYRLAAAMFQEGMSICPEAVAIHVSLGSVYMNLGQYEEAAQVLEEAIKVDPEYSTAHSYLAEAYEHLGDYAGAIEEYKEATRLDPNDGFSQSDLGKSYMMQGDVWHAAECCWILKSTGNWLDGYLADEIFRVW